jgi:hypothetical protein
MARKSEWKGPYTPEQMAARFREIIDDVSGLPRFEQVSHALDKLTHDYRGFEPDGYHFQPDPEMVAELMTALVLEGFTLQEIAEGALQSVLACFERINRAGGLDALLDRMEG